LSPNRALLIDGIARTLDTKPGEKWLVIYHKKPKKVGDIKGDVEKLLKMTPKSNINWLTWGRHMATNEYRDVEYSIIAGLNSYAEGAYEAFKRLASGRRAVDGPVTDEEYNDTRLGEHFHNLLQAGTRNASRKSVGAGCHPAHIYLIAPNNSGVPEKLTTKVFP